MAERIKDGELARWQRRIAVALGREPADLLIAGGQIVDVFAEELRRADIAIVDGRIASVGPIRDAHRTIDLDGTVIAPSFIDAHLHLESSLLWIPELARVVVPHGTGAIVTDPHEIANVAGLAGVAAFRRAASGLPLEIRFTAPSCVPASPHESPGAVFGLAEIEEMLTWPETVGLGEMMNFPGVLAGDSSLAEKLAAAASKCRDGHAPGVRGDNLQAYAGAGPQSDHESTTLAETEEKLRTGLMIMIREGSSEHNLLDLLPLVTDKTYPRVCFASDDRDCHTLASAGHMDDILNKAIRGGLDPLRAIRLATWNPAEYWRLDGLGAIAPGYWANLVVLDALERIAPSMTIFRGDVVAENGRMTANLEDIEPPPALRGSVNVAPVMLRDLRLLAANASQAVEAIPGQIVTRCIAVEPTVRDGWAVADPSRDLLKLVCVERHHATGRVGVGYVRGFGLRRGAIASTIAHDAHNIVAVGADDADILGAIATVAESGGGLAVVADGRVIEHLPLPLAGLLSDQSSEIVVETYDRLEAAARELGCELPSPFGLLAFMALSVIPEARVTDRGFLRL